MGRKYLYNRLHADYPYIKPDGLPDLIYDEYTTAFHCYKCNGESCSFCFNSGYIFLDTEKFHNIILEMYQSKKDGNFTKKSSLQKDKE